MSYQGPRNAVFIGIGKQINQARMLPFKSLREVCQKIGISAAYLCDIEHGNRRPSITMLDRIAKALKRKTVYGLTTCEHCNGLGKVNKWSLEAIGTGVER